MVIQKKKAAVQTRRGFGGRTMAQGKRNKTDVRMSPQLTELVEQAARRLGQTKNGLLVMGAAMLCAKLAPVLDDAKRGQSQILKVLEEEIQKVLAPAT